MRTFTRLGLSGLLTLVFTSGCAPVVDHIRASQAINQAEQAYSSQDYFAAAERYRQASEHGNGYAMYMLSWMYEEGEGVSRNREMAVYWMRRAASEDHPAATATIGLWHLRGDRGFSQDAFTAADHLRRAATQGDASAMALLGMLYARGQGVPQSSLEALTWLRRAEAAGYPVNPELMTHEGLETYAQNVRRANQSGSQRRTAPTGDPLVRSVQQALTARGYQPGPADGLMGQRTRQAIEAFQADQGLPVNGQVTPALLEQLTR